MWKKKEKEKKSLWIDRNRRNGKFEYLYMKSINKI